jgi:deoxyadenosine/deoxycytidine kinase
MVDREVKLKIAISGPTGTGKSTATSLMAEAHNVYVVNERVPSWLLTQLDTNPSEVCFQIQQEIMKSRLSNELAVGDEPIIVRDRTVSEDIHIFATMFESAALITNDEMHRLQNTYRKIEKEIGGPDVYVLLKANADILLERIRKAAAPQLIISLLEQQLVRYEQWYSTLSAPLVTIDTTRLDARELERHCNWVLATARAALDGQLQQNSDLGIFWE